MATKQISAKFKEFEDWLRDNSEDIINSKHRYAYVHYDYTNSKSESDGVAIVDSEIISDEDLCRFVVSKLIEIYKNYNEDTYVSVNQFIKVLKADMIGTLKNMDNQKGKN